MSAPRMHADERSVDAALARRLLVAQFPAWAEHTLQAVPSAGTDHTLYRLGEDRFLRFPRIPGAVAQVDKEQRCLPLLAPLLPLSVPVPLAEGKPGEGYPWPWSVYRWLDGEPASSAAVADPCDAATALAGFIRALQQVDGRRGPPPGPHNAFRGVPLATRDAATRRAISSLRADFDTVALSTAWEAALQAPPWRHAPVWIHGDLHGGNLLVQHGRLSAVIDFGCLGVGDPACDAIIAWNFLAPAAREVFRQELQVDDASWVRARGWALSIGLIALPYYQHTNPVLAGMSRYTIEQVLAFP